MTRVVVTGIGGKMGSRIADLVGQTSGLQLAGATESPGSFAVGTALPDGTPIVDDLEKCITRADVVIDFTAPSATLRHAEIVAKHQKALVIGTTGFNEAEKKKLKELISTIPAVWSPNMSIGVNVLLTLVTQAGKLLGDDYDIEIVEAHHRQKKDAPSGTALALAEAAALGVSRDLKQVACYERHGQIGARPEKEIGIQTLRGGDIVGDHTVMFAGMGEIIELTHRATNRDNFARGAILAAQWVAKQASGIYSMQEVLGISGK